MKSFFLSCPVCRSMSHEALFSGFHKNTVDDFQNIVICRGCGAVFRNPVMPELNHVHYQTPTFWEGDESHRDHRTRLEFVAGYVSQRVKFGPNDLYVDIGGGPGWLVDKMRSLHPDIGIVLCEPGVENGKFAKTRTAGLIAIPSRIDELTVGDGVFSLITATGVDYLFLDHRTAIQKIAAMLREDGFFYLERNVFVDQESYYGHAILDHDDLFGDNHMMNFWPGRRQFGEYISEFFDVIDNIDYNFGETLGRKCQMFGLLCNKKKSAANSTNAAGHSNYYAQHLDELQKRALLSSIEDLTILAESGLRRIAICGDEVEATALRRLIEENRLFEIDLLISSDPRLIGRDGFVALDNATFGQVDAILVASVSAQQKYRDRLKSRGFHGRILPCFRDGFPRFETRTSLGNVIQMKAFLPAYIAGMRV